MTIMLETKRLIIKVPSEQDINDQYKLQSDPDVMQYIATGVRTREEVEKILHTAIKHYQKHKFSLGSVFEKATGEFIGRAGLIYLAFDDTQPDIEVGYALLKPYWNKGYATEITKALLEWGFAHLNIVKLVAVTRPENEKSRRVLEKCGMHFVKMFQYNGIDVTYYEIYRELQFIKLKLEHISLIHKWFNLPHVKEFYSLRSWSEDEVLKKLQPYIFGEKPVYPFLVLGKGTPIAYVQYYPIKYFPWPKQDLPESIIQEGAGMDLFIGEAEFLGKGYGGQIIKQFLDKIIWPHFSYCVVDPDVENSKALKCYKKLGFKDHKIIESENALHKKVKLNLMVMLKQVPHCGYAMLKQNMQNIYGKKGRKWISDLPTVVDKLRDLWKLTNIQPVDNMSFHFVAKTMTESNLPVVLKIGFDKTVVEGEMRALKFFNGHAAIELIDHHTDYNALLLQQAVPGNSLKSLYPLEYDYVMDAYIKTMKKLHNQRLSEHHSFPYIREWLSAIDQANSDKLPMALLNKAIQLKNNLLTTSKNELLLHGDLHHDNILNNGNEWIIIDPKGVVGEAEFEIAAFDFIHSTELKNSDLRNLFNTRIQLISEKSNLDFQRIKDWVFVRLILSASWSMEDKSDPSWAIHLAGLLYG